jgi:hypothetical protein
MDHEILLNILTTTHGGDRLGAIKLGAERPWFETAFIKCDIFLYISLSFHLLKNNLHLFQHNTSFISPSRASLLLSVIQKTNVSLMADLIRIFERRRQ